MTLCYSSRLSKKIIVTIIVHMCEIVAEGVMAIIVGVSGFSMYSPVLELDIFLKVIMYVVFWGITLVIKKFKNIKKNAPFSNIFIIMIIANSVLHACTEIIIFRNPNVDYITAIIYQVCMLCSTLLMIYLYDSIAKIFQERMQTAMMEQEKDYYHEQSELLIRKQDELGQFRHDIKNRMIALHEMLEHNKVNDALAYTEEFTEKLNETGVYSNTGNLAIDSIVNYKFARAIEKGIRTEVNIVIPNRITINQDDIIVILGNLLDNAMEATERLDGEKYMHLALEYEKGTLYICVTNNYDSIIHIVNDTLMTRKEDYNLHGIGLKSVKKIVEKYNGTLDIEYSKKEFTVDILLYV